MTAAPRAGQSNAAPPTTAGDGGRFVFRAQVFDADDLRRAHTRIAHEIVERNHGADAVVLVGLYTRGVALAQRLADAIASVLGALDLGGLERRLVGTFSGGQLARVDLAVALLGSPALLVLDEPTVGLDPVLRRDLWALFHRLAAAGTSLLVSSHVMDEAARCDSLLFMRDGRFLASGSPQEMLLATGTSDLESAFLALADRTESVAR